MLWRAQILVHTPGTASSLPDTAPQLPSDWESRHQPEPLLQEAAGGKCKDNNISLSEYHFLTASDILWSEDVQNSQEILA